LPTEELTLDVDYEQKITKLSQFKLKKNPRAQFP